MEPTRDEYKPLPAMEHRVGEPWTDEIRKSCGRYFFGLETPTTQFQVDFIEIYVPMQPVVSKVTNKPYGRAINRLLKSLQLILAPDPLIDDASDATAKLHLQRVAFEMLERIKFLVERSSS